MKASSLEATQEAKLIAYSSLIRFQLEYASIIWNPHQLHLEEKLDVRNRATHFILLNYQSTSITAMKAKLNLPLLKHWREVSHLTHLHGMYYNFSLKKNEYSYISLCTDHPLKSDYT
ncbi:MAG: hypothetical protein O7D30_12835 [Rickettsia endosymbiont of Ixodes persulcatus]|nr:hypothetical protein [Rickettsia endosymbiont of Ixodes persulcatus]